MSGSDSHEDFLPGLPPAAIRTLFDHWFFARPVLMPPVWTILLLAAVDSGRIISLDPADWWFWRTCAGIILCYFLYGGVYVLNQIFDIESDRLNDKLYFLPRRVISPTAATIQYVLFTAVALIGGWYLGRVWFAVSGIIVILGVLYSIPVIRLKDRPLAGLLANAVGHGTLVYYLGYALHSPGTPPTWGPSGSYALAVAGVYLLTTVPDCAGDRATGKRTISVRYGPRLASVIAALCVAGALATSISYSQWPLVVSAAASLPFFILATVSPKSGAPAIRIALLLLTFFACLIFPPYLLVIVLIFVSTRWYYRRRFGETYPRLN